MFVVGENHGPHKHTRILKVGCSFARPSGHTTKNTRWHPRIVGATYASKAGAFRAADALGQANGPILCVYCFPGLTKAEVDEYRRIALALLDE